MKGPGSTLVRMIGVLAPHWKGIVLIAFLLAARAGTQLGGPWVTKNIFDLIIGDHPIHHLWPALLLLTGLYVASSLFAYWHTLTATVLGEKVVADLREQVFDAAQSMPIARFNESRSGDFVSRLTNDINLMKETLIEGFGILVQHLITLIVGACILLYMDPVMAISSFFFLPLIILIGHQLGRRIRRLSQRVQERMSDLTTFISEAISGIRVLKAFTLEPIASRLFRRENRGIVTVVAENARVQAGLSAIMGFLGSATFVFVAGVGGYRVMVGAISPGELVAFFLYIDMIAGPLGLLAGLYGRLQHTAAAADRIFEIIDAPKEWQESLAVSNQIHVPNRQVLLNTRSPRLPDPVHGDIVYERVFFSYKDKPVIKDVSFRVAPGESVALVGPSGGGKSTLLNLLLKYYELDGGRIMIDGVDIAHVPPRELRSHIGIVPQETLLFAMTVRENIACGRPDATFDEIQAAARAANAHDFIESLEHGYDTIIGERGIKLSGGQRQRIAIARVLLKNPPILLLDEATSALDTHAETIVQEALERLRQNRTTLVVAHRLSTVRTCDRIMVVENGRIVEEGTHQDLLNLGGAYARLSALHTMV